MYDIISNDLTLGEKKAVELMLKAFAKGPIIGFDKIERVNKYRRKLKNKSIALPNRGWRVLIRSLWYVANELKERMQSEQMLMVVGGDVNAFRSDIFDGLELFLNDIEENGAMWTENQGYKVAPEICDGLEKLIRGILMNVQNADYLHCIYEEVVVPAVNESNKWDIEHELKLDLEEEFDDLTVYKGIPWSFDEWMDSINDFYELIISSKYGFMIY